MLSVRRAIHVCASAGIVFTLTGIAVLPAAAEPAPEPVTYFNPKPGADPLPKIAAQSWVVVDADSGNILAAKDPDHEFPPASTLKVLTAYTLVPRLNMDSRYTAQMQDINQPGTKVGLHAGSSYQVEDLVAGMLMNSGNDAASALANAYGGWDQAVALMNSEAQRLGATHTHALTPNGLDKYEQVTTSEDLATFFRAVLEIPAVAKILLTKQREMVSSDNRHTELYSHNKMLQKNYPGHLGAKPGYTSMAGHTMVAATQRNGHTLIVAAMRTGMTMESLSERLFEWGFANVSKLNAVGQLPPKVSLPDVQPQDAVSDGHSDPASDGASDEKALPDVPVGAAVAPNPVSSPSNAVANSQPPLDLLVIFGLLATAGAVVWQLRRKRVTDIRDRDVDLREEPLSNIHDSNH